MNKTFINLTLDNIDSEHICCAISDKKHQNGVSCKKEWLKNQFNSSHVFRKLNERCKAVISPHAMNAPITGITIPLRKRPIT